MISAQTAVLCGKVPSLRGRIVQLIQADELILVGVQLEHLGGLGTVSMIANRLILWGASQIEMIGQTSGAVSFGASLNLSVKESISADDEGRLVISVRG